MHEQGGSAVELNYFYLGQRGWINIMIHPLADVQTKSVGSDTRIWQFVVVLPQARIGKECNICSHCFIENDVIIGNKVTIKNGVYLWDGLRIEDDVFIGPNVTFTNDKFPRSAQYPEAFLQTKIGRGASIGGGAVILPGLAIGEFAMVGAGSVVTRSVPSRAVVIGNPARVIRYLEAGNESSQQSPDPEGTPGVR